MSFRPFRNSSGPEDPGNEFDPNSNRNLFLFGLVALVIILVINVIRTYL